jgi:ribosome-associated toxin RatA of RatAB toxin-antitoxin module
MLTKIAHSAFVNFSSSEMFALVNNIGDYAQFLPHCTQSVVHHQTDNIIEATLEIELSVSVPFLGKQAKRQQFRTKNILYPTHRMDMALISGPLKQLRGSWIFEDVGIGQSQVTLMLDIEFESTMLSVAFNAVSHKVGEQLVQAFIDRAHAIYLKGV